MQEKARFLDFMVTTEKLKPRGPEFRKLMNYKKLLKQIPSGNQ